MSRRTLALAAKEQPFGELIALTVLAALGIFLIATAGQYTVLRDDGQVGGGFLPLIAGIALTALSGLQLIGTAAKVRRLLRDPAALERTAAVRVQANAEPDAFGRTGKERLRQLGKVVIALILAVAATPLVGLLGGLALLSIYISWFVERRPWWTSILISAISVGLVFAIFVLLLGIPLPNGLLIELLTGAA